MTRLLPKLEPLANDGPVVVKAVGGRGRLDCIDLLRGLVMVIMALDHVKGFLPGNSVDATDLTSTSPAYFLTRWITHFCAPTFVFLAGTGAFLYGARGKTKLELAGFLFTRGLWLLILELTVIRFSWFMNVDYGFSVGQVIWAIGWSMIVLAGLVFLPTSSITVFGVAMILFHNFSDRISAADWGAYGWLWRLLHTGEQIQVFPGKTFFPLYPLIPWIGVLAAGYGFGALMLLDPHRRRKEVLGLGLAVTLLFIALRFSNVYGDKPAIQAGQPGPWSVQRDWLFTVFSFANCQKYPPSLCFLLMTLGPAILVLAVFDRQPGLLGRVMVTFGRVPLFFYILHFYLIRLLSIGFAYARYGRADWLYGDTSNAKPPSDNGYDLWVVYLAWIGVVLILYPLCYWFAGVKSRSRAARLSYL
jgi:uncharacterized membrane protein